MDEVRRLTNIGARLFCGMALRPVKNNRRPQSHHRSRRARLALDAPPDSVGAPEVLLKAGAPKASHIVSNPVGNSDDDDSDARCVVASLAHEFHVEGILVAMMQELTPSQQSSVIEFAKRLARQNASKLPRTGNDSVVPKKTTPKVEKKSVNKHCGQKGHEWSESEVPYDAAVPSTHQSL